MKETKSINKVIILNKDFYIYDKKYLIAETDNNIYFITKNSINGKDIDGEYIIYKAVNLDHIYDTVDYKSIFHSLYESSVPVGIFNIDEAITALKKESSYLFSPKIKSTENKPMKCIPNIDNTYNIDCEKNIEKNTLLEILNLIKHE